MVLIPEAGSSKAEPNRAWSKESRDDGRQPPENVNVAVIGAGGIARSAHLPSLAEMADVEVVAVCDLIASRAREAADGLAGACVHTLYKEMLAAEGDRIDAAFVLVEPSNLFDVTWHCLDAGLCVFMEKPPGLNSFQCESLARKSA